VVHCLKLLLMLGEVPQRSGPGLARGLEMYELPARSISALLPIGRYVLAVEDPMEGRV